MREAGPPHVDGVPTFEVVTVPHRPPWPSAVFYLAAAADWLRLPAHERPRPAMLVGPESLLEAALSEGAADFEPSPASSLRLAARIKGRIASAELATGELEKAGLRLSPLERRTLTILLLEGGATVSREALSYAIWGCIDPGSRRLDVLISSLRKRLGLAGNGARWEITSHRGMGISLRVCPVDNLCIDEGA